MFKKIKQTYRALGVTMSPVPVLPSSIEAKFRVDFLREEINELVQAQHKDDLVGMADALADIVIVALGMGAVMGLPMGKIIDVVNTANRNGKLKVTSAAESKRGYSEDLYKTEDFVSPEPEIKRLLEARKWIN